MNLYKQRPLIVLSILLFALSLTIRYLFLGLSNRDIILLIEKWYDYLYNNGWAGLANEKFSNYPPAYLYLLWVSTFFGDTVGRVAALKIFPTLFDVLSTFVIFCMARLRYETDDRPYLLSAIFFTLPTIMFNSTGWGQIDSYFTAFLLLCTYLLMKEKPFWGMIAFGIALSFKAQAIFLLPFLGIMFLKRKIRWYYFLLVPIIYIILAIPTALTGRSWASILTIYVGQVGQFRKLSNNAPNLYAFVPDQFYDTGLLIGLAIFIISMAAWGWVNWRANNTLTHRKIALMALAALALVLFTLPKMHDRYFYPVDVFAFAAVIFVPEMWFIPLLYQISSVLSYTVFNLGAPVIVVMIGALINTFSIIYIIKKQADSLREK